MGAGVKSSSICCYVGARPFLDVRIDFWRFCHHGSWHLEISGNPGLSDRAEKCMNHEESQLTVTQQDGVSLVCFREASVLDAYHVGQVSKDLYALIEKQGLRKLVLDLSSIKMLSSQTLGVLLNMRQKLDQLGGKMVLSGIDPRLYRVFKITHLKDLFEFYETNEEAIASFQ